MQIAFLCLALTAGSALAARKQAAEPVSLVTIPLHMYAQDCGKDRPTSVSLISNSKTNSTVPGAGLGKYLAPGANQGKAKVLKDGFFQVDCVKDMMFNFGDKFGDQKHDYNLGDVSNVSIVHYSLVVPKEDREEMTHEICFEFCRTVPDMLFFGITHGRECYCAPYFKAMAGDSSDCDEVCSAKPTQMCGGKTKSMIFGMHQCADTKTNLQAASSKANDVADTLSTSIGDVTSLSQDMQTGAQKLQDQFGKDGNPDAADLFQHAKDFAGTLEHAAEKEQKLLAELQPAAMKAAKMGFATTFDESETVAIAEALTTDMEKMMTDAEDGVEELSALSKLASPVDADLKGTPSKQYYSLMYFVDKKFENVPSTCGGDVTKEPMIGVSVDECAQACDAAVLTCVGYSYYPEDKFCFLFSKFKSATYYTGCPSFLQQNATSGSHPTCYAKLSEFENTDITPDPSGKSTHSLTTLTKAARCYK